jgi:ubiquinone/menaquinone biosynthesis C-methylase UbiE
VRIKKSLAMFAGTSVLILGIALAASAQQTEMPRPTQALPLQQRIAAFENPNRDKNLKPDEVVRALGLKNGDVVADIGAGTGYFSRRFARAVGPNGKVYAVDIDAEILDYLKQQAEKEHLANIETVVSTPEDPMLPAGSVDLAFFCDVVHHIQNRAAFYRKVAQGLKAHGRMVIIDFVPGGPAAPHKADELVPPAEDKRETGQAGFKFVKDYQFLEPNFYFLVFEKE